ncbi:hypothetical protein PC116_g3249 [Phytophthora cactorum]|uniref:Uncharacterized protein n=1 Tax=Phytophthora cactorum TaxID=29920 RepID=A0A8T1LR06_9STRA|nr:hypothetical protein PC117_g6221 [Phytophthora cactorum]KAG3031723.1 hypothetical protein PC119_g5860 [Phytophthora cactorum]KAG3196552.1 hypothetical protein PC128_g7570 [Phytophthora cactorum]KAG4249081.1 hypothetical protein PC116_g3249 [Phytophthora cactorum]
MKVDGGISMTDTCPQCGLVMLWFYAIVVIEMGEIPLPYPVMEESDTDSLTPLGHLGKYWSECAHS